MAISASGRASANARVLDEPDRNASSENKAAIVPKMTQSRGQAENVEAANCSVDDPTKSVYVLYKPSARSFSTSSWAFRESFFGSSTETRTCKSPREPRPYGTPFERTFIISPWETPIGT